MVCSQALSTFLSNQATCHVNCSVSRTCPQLFRFTLHVQQENKSTVAMYAPKIGIANSRWLVRGTKSIPRYFISYALQSGRTHVVSLKDANFCWIETEILSLPLSSLFCFVFL